MGQDAEIIEKAIQIDIPIYHALNLHDAVSIAVNISEEKDTVLFSPACASFDMFNSFEHRGECFISEVEALK